MWLLKNENTIILLHSMISMSLFWSHKSLWLKEMIDRIKLYNIHIYIQHNIQYSYTAPDYKWKENYLIIIQQIVILYNLFMSHWIVFTLWLFTIGELCSVNAGIESVRCTPKTVRLFVSRLFVNSSFFLSSIICTISGPLFSPAVIWTVTMFSFKTSDKLCFSPSSLQIGLSCRYRCFRFST